jgi:hypothetical protein
MTVARWAAVGAVLGLLVLLPPVQAAPGKGTLFGTDAASGQLITIDQATGTGTVVGFMGFVAPSLAVDPTTGTMYAGSGAGFAALFTVDPATGSATFVGDTGLGFAAVGGLDFRSDGTLFAAVNIVGDGGTGSETLATINKATGAATIIGAFGVEGMEGIAFDSSGTLWGSTSARAGRPPSLYTINPATGAATLVAPIADSSGRAPSGGVVSLQFACDGTLYGGTARATTFPPTDGGRLITIDPATGTFAFVGPGPAAVGTSLGALAFQDSRCLPTSKDQCKNGGWRDFGVFKNQGDCVSFVATGGKNPPANSP